MYDPLSLSGWRSVLDEPKDKKHNWERVCYQSGSISFHGTYLYWGISSSIRAWQGNCQVFVPTSTCTVMLTTAKYITRLHGHRQGCTFSALLNIKCYCHNAISSYKSKAYNPTLFTKHLKHNPKHHHSVPVVMGQFHTPMLNFLLALWHINLSLPKSWITVCPTTCISQPVCVYQCSTWWRALFVCTMQAELWWFYI